MKKLVSVFCFLGWIAADLHAQSNIVASGGNASGSGGSVSYSIGQIDYATQTGTGGVMTEGVQQPFEISVVNGIKEEGINLNAVVFPNPTSDFVELQINNVVNESLHYEMFDLNGRIIEENIIKGNMAKINMALLSSGIYYLKISDNNKMIKTFQINKCN